MDRKINVGLIQMTCSEDIEGNFDKALDYIREAAGRGAQIICTQELFKSPYCCQAEDWRAVELAEEVGGSSPTVRRLSQLAAELEIVLMASLFEKRATGIYHNTAVVLDADGRYLGKYRKMHIPDDPHYYEKFYFTPGDLGYKVFKHRYADIGVLICSDQSDIRPQKKGVHTTTPGVLSSRVMLSPTPAIWLRSTGLASKPIPQLR